MCIQKKKTDREPVARDQPPKPGNTQDTQHNSQPEKKDEAAAAAAPAVDVEKEEKPKEKPKKKKDEKKSECQGRLRKGGSEKRREENSDNTLEDVPSLMPEIELEMLKERDQVLSDSQLL